MAEPRIAVAGDHAGFPLKSKLIGVLKEEGWTVLDLGTRSEESVDYPDYGYAMADAIAAGRAERGLIVCGTGIGIAMAANRHPMVRAAVCGEPVSATLARRHNDANVLALGARLIGESLAVETLKAFLAAPFDGGRHSRRIDKLSHPSFESGSRDRAEPEKHR